MATPQQIPEGRFSGAEMDALASAVCLVVFLVPLFQMLLMSGWLAIVVLKFRLMKYGWRKGRIPFVIATLHALTSVGAALFSRSKDAHTRTQIPESPAGLVPISSGATPATASKILVLIPGTWDTAVESPAYFDPLIQSLGELSRDVAIFVFKWTSTNEAHIRTHAARVLADQLLGAAPAKAVLAGYSHGGTIAVLAAEHLKGRVATRVVTASAPIVTRGDDVFINADAATHIYASADPLMAQLQVSHSARRRQVALARILQRRLTAAVSSSLLWATLRMLAVLFVLSMLPSGILLALLAVRAADPLAIPADTSVRELMWINFVILATLFVLWFRNPLVDTVYKMLKQAIFAMLFAVNSPVFAVLFGVRLSDVLGYRYRLREPLAGEMGEDAPPPWDAHRSVLSSQALAESIRVALE